MPDFTSMLSREILYCGEQLQKLKKTGQITVIVEDQGSIHVSRATKEQYKRWESQGLYIFLLPTYSPELNRIENEWQRLKRPLAKVFRGIMKGYSFLA